MALLIDASIFITLERTQRLLSEVNALTVSDTFAISALTASELLAGIWRDPIEARRNRRLVNVEMIISSFTVIGFDLAAARVHARLLAHLFAAGTPIGKHDAIVAASALAIGFGVLTDNVGEFSRVPGLEVVRPRWTAP